MLRKKSNYKKEYKNYHSKSEQVKNRQSRNKARRILKSKGVIVKGKDVAHRNGNPKDNRISNLTVKLASKNRSFSRTRKSKKRNPMA